MSSDELFKMLKADGWVFIRSKGSHHTFKHPVKKGIVVLPHPKKDIPKGTEHGILKQAGLI
ncbi:MULTISPECIES: type II toxin-antitoxin system HicA family toxin [Flavobacterium]|jgi:predicted RNA binding protein YcfA (HicA-like mRNA interferase family)|uniref:type II toxin-antitoxin system HicA family toxin n=1 Tax=Flavobacterium TaxID=237 RepID=UPI0011820365|nr:MULTISPECIES: type II toxin-antitoxin system HicA family toxin [Flavobacterium]MCR4033636.1 type II toxin-antitoxin system HicA family toxin [Flavobacterium panacis]